MKEILRNIANKYATLRLRFNKLYNILKLMTKKFYTSCKSYVTNLKSCNIIIKEMFQRKLKLKRNLLTFF